MALEKPSSPPPRVAIRQYTTPVIGEGFFTERVDYSLDSYRPIQRGAKYSNQIGADPQVIAQFPDLYFLKETREPRSHPWGIRIWATDRTAEDSYNSAVEYVSEAVNFPAYTRIYMVRRDVYDATPAKAIGTPLDSIIGVKIINQGAQYSNAQIQIDPANGADIEPIIDSSNGGNIISAVVKKQGSGFSSPPTLTIVGDGGDAKAVAIIQPQSAVLVQQKKSELPDDHPLRNEYVLVTQVYETLPGPWVISQKVDNDGIVVTVKKRRNVSADIVAEDSLTGNLWSQTTKDGQDDYVAEEINESRTLRVDSTPVKHLTTERVDEDGMAVTVTREMASQTYFDTITPRETISSGIWIRITSEPVDDIRVWLITEKRPLPGNPIIEDKIEEDGKPSLNQRTLKADSAITPTEAVGGGYWTKIESKAVSELVSWEVITARPVPGNPIPSANIDNDMEVAFSSRTLKDQNLITPSASESSGIITTVEKKDVSDLVSQEIVTQKLWLDETAFKVTIPEGIIPEEFRAFVPFKTESHVRAGTATMPTLASQEFEHTRQQKNKLLYMETIVTLGNIALPVTQTGYLMTELNGGGILRVDRTLHSVALAADEGFLVVASKSSPLGNGMWFRETRSLYNETAWTELVGTHVDPKYEVIFDVKKKVVPAGTLGGVDPDGTVREVRPNSKWRSIQFATKLHLDSLPAPVQWETTINKRFPSELIELFFLWAFAGCGCSTSYSIALESNIKQGYSGPCRGLITESFTLGPPADPVSVQQFFPQAHSLGLAWASACCGDEGGVTKSAARTFPIPATLHDDLILNIDVVLSGGVVTNVLPATTPPTLPPPGTLINHFVNVEQWRFGVFYRRLEQVYIPG